MDNKLKEQNITIQSIDNDDYKIKCLMGHIVTVKKATIQRNLNKNTFVCTVCSKHKTEIKFGE